MFVPSASAKALIGVANGTYSMTLDPTRKQSFSLGPNHLDIPANAVCDLSRSGYGAAYWDKPCLTESHKFTLTVVIKNASSAHPSMDFSPAMRFNPKENVQLYMYAPNVSQTDAKNWLIYYCPDRGKCVDESLTDRDLVTQIDYSAHVLFRRLKHFSGYMVAEFADPTNVGQ
ncbi:MAG TPA: hypothetical protein VIJ90_08215 [Gemmatimonadaceae bacterium]